MAASKVLPVDSAVETRISKTPNSTPDEDVTAAPAPKPRTWTQRTCLALFLFAFIGFFVSFFGFIISAMCGWDRLAQAWLTAFDIWGRFGLLVGCVGAFLLSLTVLFCPCSLAEIGTKFIFGLVFSIGLGAASYVILLSLAEDGIDVKESCAIVAAVYLLLFALAWCDTRHARSAAAAEATTNTPEPKRKVISELV